jgi:lysozyme
MQTSENGRKLIESFEGLRLTSYQDPRGVWTIGYGHTNDVYPNLTITPEQADVYLAMDLHVAETVVNGDVKVDINQNQFDALVSLAYNIGVGAFAKSTLLSLLNQGALTGASQQFLVWDHINGVVDKGLLNRRIAEQTLFNTPIKEDQ